jgi:hypothetical protein
MDGQPEELRQPHFKRQLNGNSHVFINTGKRTVATLLTAIQGSTACREIHQVRWWPVTECSFREILTPRVITMWLYPCYVCSFMIYLFYDAVHYLRLYNVGYTVRCELRIGKNKRESAGSLGCCPGLAFFRKTMRNMSQ